MMPVLACAIAQRVCAACAWDEIFIHTLEKVDLGLSTLPKAENTVSNNDHEISTKMVILQPTLSHEHILFIHAFYFLIF